VGKYKLGEIVEKNGDGLQHKPKYADERNNYHKAFCLIWK
jgi:hypothetical protein